MKTKIKLLIILLFLANTIQMFGQNTGFRKYPYILLKQDTVTIMWQLYSNQNCTFKYKKAADLSFINVAVNTPYNDKLYKYELTNLENNTLYDFEVLLSDGNQKSGSFLSPPPSTAQEISFYGYGDTRGDGETTHSPFHDEVCKQVNTEIDNFPSSRTLIIHSGDWNINDNEIAWDNQYFYKEDTNAIKLRTRIGVVGCIGNHEADYNEAANYRKYWPYDYAENIDNFWYSYDYGPVHFCFADQRWPDWNSSIISETQQAWIRNDLKTSNKRWKILVFHPPVYSKDADPDQYNINKTFFDGLCDSTEVYGVNMVLNGHIHVYSDWLVNGVHHLTLGGGGSHKKSNPLPYVKDTTNPNIIRYLTDNHYHFAKIDIHNQYAKIKITYWNNHDNAWKIYDEFITPHSFTINDGENIIWEDHGVHYYADSVVVKTGATLTIKGDIEFERDGKIIVEPGGKLILDNALLTCLGVYNDTETHWQGIQVYGNPNASQYPDANGNYAQGMLILKNGATIENAVNAVALQNSDKWGHSGGIVFANNAHFINNRRSVEFLSYQNTFPPTGEVCDNVSRFTNCDFVYDDNYNISTALRTHVTMWEVDGVKFNGCTFTDEMSNPVSNSYAIYTIDAGYRVNDYCNAQIAPCPVDSVLRSAFISFDTAVYSANTEKPYSFISVKNSNFENNGVGIDLGLVYGSVIVNDTFKIGAIENECGYKAGIGLSLDNSKLFAVEQNHFQRFSSEPLAQYIGIYVKNTNNESDEIYQNTFHNLDVSIQADGKNWVGESHDGLAYYCNGNTDNQCDFFVHRKLSNDGIQAIQGFDSLSAGNTFSPNAQNEGNFNNEAAYILQYYYDNGTYKYPAKRKNVNTFLTSANTCPSHYGNGDITLSSLAYQQRETDYNNALASYNSASSNYDAASDSATRSYWAGKMSDYNTEKARAAYDIIRSDMADTISHPGLFKTWMEKLDTYSSNEALVDYYLQASDYTTALNKVDSLPYRFTFTAYDSIEYPMYKDYKHMQAAWLSDGRTIFDLTTTEINSLIAIADSSKGTAGVQARAILRFAYPSQYSYTECIDFPDNSTKSAELKPGNTNENHSAFTVTVRPNPARNRVTFQYTLPENTETARLSLYNINGKLLFTGQLAPNPNKLQYNCSHLKAGVYYYTVSTSNETVSGKWIIVR